MKLPHFPPIALFIPASLALLAYFYDLGNIDGLRQGTEGFYLLITREMFETGHFLTPRLAEANHWSKPPLHFWLPMPLYALASPLGPIHYLAIARASIVLFTLAGVGFIARWNQRHFQRPFGETLFYFLACLGILKYARIYMMEMPLALLTTCAGLAYYDYALSGEKRACALAVLFAGASCLVKGPVSLAMLAGGVGAWTLVQTVLRRRVVLTTPLLWLSFSVLASAPWFAWCWYTYGDEFFNYFFLRENVGKFTTQSYPVRSLIQGLLLYGLPFTLLLPQGIRQLARQLKESPQVLLFLICCFISFYSLWFFPNQRSHHYAVPALPVLLLILQNTVLVGPAFLRGRLCRWVNAMASVFFATVLALFAHILSLDGIPSMEGQNIRIGVGMGLVLAGLGLLWKRSHLTQWNSGWMATLAGVWVFLLPLLALPVLPSSVVQTIMERGEKRPISVVFRKPFFIEERLGKKVATYSPHQIKGVLSNALPGDLAIVPETVFTHQNLANAARIVKRWPLWRRKASTGAVLRALEEGDASSLKDDMLLIEKR